MESIKFRKLLDTFEKNIIVEGILRKRFTKKGQVSTKRGKLFYNDFGKILGSTIDTSIILAIDYYGYIKRSKGFLNKLESTGNPIPTEMKSYIVHFASVKMEDIAFMTNDVSVMIDFPRLKNEILILRGFRRRS